MEQHSEITGAEIWCTAQLQRFILTPFIFVCISIVAFSAEIIEAVHLTAK
jgi:hypothetical protein